MKKIIFLALVLCILGIGTITAEVIIECPNCDSNLTYMIRNDTTEEITQLQVVKDGEDILLISPNDFEENATMYLYVFYTDINPALPTTKGLDISQDAEIAGEIRITPGEKKLNPWYIVPYSWLKWIIPVGIGILLAFAILINREEETI